MSNAQVVATRLQTVKYFKIAGAALLAFDYCINFEAEVSLTWGRSWGYVRCLFVMARYLPFIDVPIDIYYSFIPRSPASCLLLYQAASWLNVFGTIAAEGLLLIRTWVLLGRDKRVLACLIGLAAACTAGCGVVGASVLRSMKFAPPPLSTTGCLQASSVSPYMWDYVILAAYEMTILLLTSYQAFHHKRIEHSPLVARLHWDGIFYVMCILVMSSLNIVVIGTLVREYAELIDTLQAVAHSILSSRLLFNLRNIIDERNVVMSTRSSRSALAPDSIPMFAIRSGQITVLSSV